MLTGHLALTASALFTGAALYINVAAQPARRANWPFALIGIMPTNSQLMGTASEAAGPPTRALIERWGDLHAVRTILGALSTVIFLWALN